MITAYDLYALTQESQTACYLLPELCKLAGVSEDDVKAPNYHRAKSDNLADPFTERLQ